VSSSLPQLDVPPTPTLAQVAVDELQEAILSGRLAAGAPIRLEETARALGMSPSPVREALRELGRLGLVVHVPHKGAHVAELSFEDMQDTYAVRILLETQAIGLAAARFGDGDRAAAEAHLAEYGKALERQAMREARTAHAAFHFTLYAPSGSQWLLRLIRPAWENSERYRFMTAASAGSLQERDAEHRALLAACAAHEAERASSLLEAHLLGSCKSIVGRLKPHVDI
jgi:DNA-binding GntR family transcriptional regulator